MDFDNYICTVDKATTVAKFCFVDNQLVIGIFRTGPVTIMALIHAFGSSLLLNDVFTLALFS